MVIRLGSGNSKLGRVLTFSLPAVDTCPGSTQVCRKSCYAIKGRYKTTTVKNSLQNNLTTSKQNDFHTLMVQELKKSKLKLMRIHPAGDFYDKEYANKWLHIISNSPHIRFWFYTRSWRIDNIREIIEKIADLSNCRVWYSIDKETRIPEKMHPKIRLAYMTIAKSDVPNGQSDLVFRDYHLRGVTQIRDAGVIVCPVENGKGWHGTCQQCKLCFRNLNEKDTRLMKQLPVFN